MRSPIKLISGCFVFILLLTLFWLPSAFCAQKPEVNTNVMSGILSIGPDGNIYIQFTKSHAKFTKSTSVGDLIMGKIPEELTVEQADQHELQKAAYLAYNAWLKCQTAKKKAADGKITAVQMEYDCSRYRLYSAEEGLADARAINNNLGIDWAIPYYEISKLDSENAKKDVQNALNNGAVPTPEGYQPPGGEVGFTSPINISDPNIDTGKYILDTVPLSQEEAAHASPQ
jgi:hypothetical protein